MVKNSELQTKVNHQEAKIEELNENIDRLEIEKVDNQKEYLALNTEVEVIVKNFEDYQNENANLEEIIKLKDIKCQELEYKLRECSKDSKNTSKKSTNLLNHLQETVEINELDTISSGEVRNDETLYLTSSLPKGVSFEQFLM